MKDLVKIDPSDIRKLNVNMDQFHREFNIITRKALSNLGARIVADAQANISRNDSKVTGQLINSGAVRDGKDGTIHAGFKAIYAYYVEFGRRAGKKPPFVFIYQWVRKRHFAKDDKEAQSMAYAVRWNIGLYGTKPHPFLRAAYDRNKRLLVQIIIKATMKIMKKDYTR